MSYNNSCDARSLRDRLHKYVTAGCEWLIAFTLWSK